jgi:hypothetical protein
MASSLWSIDSWVPRGAIQHINGYEAADGRIGVEAFTERAQELAEKYGSHFSRPPSCSTRRRTVRSSPDDSRTRGNM